MRTDPLPPRPPGRRSARLPTAGAFVLLACGVACNDYGFGGKDAPVTGQDPTDSGDGVDTDVSHTEELCNGLDDDGDGLVDEDYSDDDGDGVADCREAACPSLDVGVAGSYTIQDACEASPSVVADPWSYVIEWGYVAANTNETSVTPPVVANLTDDDGDGDIDEHDVPDVLIVDVANTAYVLDGATGARGISFTGPVGGATPVVADADGDGAPDIVTYDWPGRVARYDAAGVRQARSEETFDDTWALSVADLDGDGAPEVIAADGILDGATLEVRARWEEAYTGQYIYSTVGDVDLDGDQEIFRNGILYDSDGGVVWDAGMPLPTTSFGLLVQADADDEAELALLGQRYTLFDTDGTVLVEGPVFADFGAGTGAPAAGDFDGDGETEIAFPIYYEGPFVLMELDGTEAWATTTPWRTLGAGVTGCDLDGDGALEILYATDEAFYVYDGRTGATRFTYTAHMSPTLFEFAVPADVDGDGHAEIVMVSPSSSSYAVSVLGHDGPGWAPVGPTWPQNDYAEVQIEVDGHVPATPEAAWLTSKTWRARAALQEMVPAPDLRVVITDVCVADCTLGSVEVAVQVANEGAADSVADVRLVLYAIESDGDRAVAETTVGPVVSGTALDGVRFALSPADLGAFGFAAAVDVDDVVSECDEDDNTDRWEDSYCL